MSHNSIVAGLDIGATRVTEVIARVRDEGEIDVLGVGEEPCQASVAELLWILTKLPLR